MDTVRNVLIDLNGCVTGPPSQGLYEGMWKLAQLVDRTKKNGSLLIGACSGREMPYVRGVLHTIGSPKGWSICESGLGIYHVLEDDVEEPWVPNPLLTSEVKRAFEDELLRIRVPRILARHPGQIRFYRGNEVNIALELTSRATFTIEQFHMEIQDDLKDLLDQGLAIARHSTDTEDISAPGIHKGAGVVQVEEITGIPRTQTLGIGDTDGDLPMLELVGFVGCPANARIECKEYVRSRNGHISPFKYTLGVVDIIEHFTGG